MQAGDFDAAEAKELIRNASPEAINYQNHQGLAPVHYAVIYNREDLVKELLVKSADLSIRDINQFSPLYVSLSDAGSEITKIIFDASSTQILIAEIELALSYPDVIYLDSIIKYLPMDFFEQAIVHGIKVETLEALSKRKDAPEFGKKLMSDDSKSYSKEDIESMEAKLDFTNVFDTRHLLKAVGLENLELIKYFLKYGNTIDNPREYTTNPEILDVLNKQLMKSCIKSPSPFQNGSATLGDI